MRRGGRPNPVFTGEFHEYARGLGVPDGSGQDYFDVEMPRMLKELAAGLQPHERLDGVIVDEAQDFAPLWWDALLACTASPATGEVYAFMDDRQDVYRRWSGASANLAHGPMATLVPIHIDDNLRNTRKIAETFRPFAGEHFTPRGTSGLPVRFVECATEASLDIAGDCVEALIDEGWANNHIALLTTKERHPIHLDCTGLQRPGALCCCPLCQWVQGHEPGQGTALRRFVRGSELTGCSRGIVTVGGGRRSGTEAGVGPCASLEAVGGGCVAPSSQIVGASPSRLQ